MSAIFASTRNTRRLLPDSWRYLRSDVPTAVTQAERQRLIDHGVTTIVDLREASEQSEKPCPLAQDARFRCLHLPVTGGNAVPQDVDSVSASYLAMVDDQMHRIIRALRQSEGNALYFCNAGKDRTGVVSAILLSLLGATDEEIVADYMLSRENLRPLLAQFAETHPDFDIAVITPQPRYMQEFLQGFRQMKTTFLP